MLISTYPPRFNLIFWLLLVSVVFFSSFMAGVNAQDNKVTLCHNGNTLNVSQNALQDHLNHGDVEGACDTSGILTINPTSHDFGEVNINLSSTEQTFILTNTNTSLQFDGIIDVFGNVTTTLDELGNVIKNYTDSSEFSVTDVTSTCENGSIGTFPDPSGECNITVAFKPDAVGQKTDALYIPYFDAFGNSTSLMIPLEGTGINIPIPNIEASLTSYDFEDVEPGRSSDTQAIRISNSGLADLQLDKLTLSDTENFVFEDYCSYYSRRPSYSCTVFITFKPKSGGLKTAILSIPSDDPDTPTLEISLSGKGIAPIPNIEVTPLSENFGKVQINNVSTYKNITIKNTGDGSLQMGQITFSNQDFEMFADYCSNRQISRSSNCALNVRFKAQSAGVKTATLSIPSNDPDTPTVDVSLNGEGVNLCPDEYEQHLSVWPNKPNFGAELVGSSTLMYQNAYSQVKGCNALKIKNISVSNDANDEFAITTPECWDGYYGNESYSSCSWQMSFSPKSAGIKNADLTIKYTDNSEKVIPIQAAAVDSGEANFTVSPNFYDYGEVPIYRDRSQFFTATNTGNVNLKLSNQSWNLVKGTNPDNFRAYASWWSCGIQLYSPGENSYMRLPPSAECPVDSSFTPRSPQGAKHAYMVFDTNTASPTSVPLTGVATAAEDVVDCSPENITIESNKDGVWATKTPYDNQQNYSWWWEYRGYVGDSDAWTRVKNPYGEYNAAPNRPTELDVVLIKSGHTITGIPHTKIRALCIESGATLESLEGIPTYYPNMHIYATDHISNKGEILGQNGINEVDNEIACSRYNWWWWNEEEAKNCAQPGTSIGLYVAYYGEGNWHNRQGEFRNEGVIQAGNGGNGKKYGAPGGSVWINDTGLTNTGDGIIRGGKGGDITGTTSGVGGWGGQVSMWGSDYLVSDGQGIRAGDGGNCNSSATEAQTGGRGGNMRLNARNNVDLLAGTFATGLGGIHCTPLGTNGQRGGFNTDPSVLNLSGTNTKIEGGDVTIFGGKDWIINLNNLSDTALTATGNITIAVGEGGAINMTGNTGKILKAAGQVNIFADNVLLDGGKQLSDIIEASNIVVGPGKVLRDVSVTTPTNVSGEPKAVLPITITVSNGGPEKETFLINVTDTAGWKLSEIPASIELDGLQVAEVQLNVTLPKTAGATNNMTISAISQINPNAEAPSVSAKTEVQVTVVQSESQIADIDKGILNIPGVDTVVNGGEVTIVAAAEEGRLDMSNLGNSKVVTSTQDIILAIGENGVIDLTGNSHRILETTAKVIIYADSSQILSDVDLSILFGSNYEIRSRKSSRQVSLVSPGNLSKPVGAVVPLKFTLTNEGLKADAYLLNVTDSLGLPLTKLPVKKRVKGLKSVELLLNVGLIAAVGATDTITVTAISMADSNVIATATAQVIVIEPVIDDTTVSNTVVVSKPPAIQNCPDTGIISGLCSNRGQVMTNATIESGASIASGTMAGTVNNKGLISQVTVQEEAMITGGKLTGRITNKGTLADFEFVGASVEGGTLSGTIHNNSEIDGVFKNVHLAANTVVNGGTMQGDIEGEMDAPAILENVTIKSGTQLSNVILRGSVQFEENITFGSGVLFDHHDIIPLNVELIGLLPELSSTAIEGVTYPERIDFSADVVESSDGILPAINELPLFKDNAWTLIQNSELSDFELDVGNTRYAVLPVSVEKVEASAGMELQDAQSLRFITETGLGVLTHPALQMPSALQTALSKVGLGEFTVGTNGNLSIPSSDEQWFSARPDWLSTALSSETETGLLFGNSPHTSGLLSTTLVFNDTEGVLREQHLHPAVAYPEVLYSSAKNVSIEPYGLVNFKLGNQIYRGVMDYVVIKDTESSTTLQVESVPDANGDGIDDVSLVYPGGEQQIMFVME
ncbi:choice-of-anchor D domain-containing protein [Candidatus Parabeggiatoa sp. HSG14]|uniref:choice-of-anchor D domain-containing protein n=1 Tax=Candidatus Parabeggiatoa sp. HSG14 TaxID=3055593 RepID=UPI0025A80E9A|nr:choice-of-anchor D domain-containing protein [Thiotrichales bacterium HSG14]